MTVQATTVQRGIIRPSGVLRPSATVDYRSKSSPVRIGVVVAVVGIMVAMAAFIGSLVNANLVATNGSETDILTNNAWTFGVATVGLGTLKIGIALILLGIVRMLWVRVESVKAGLAKLVSDVPNQTEISSSRVSTPYGTATHTERAPRPLLIHRMAFTMWAPMLLMGATVTAIGLVLSLVEAGVANGDRSDYLTLSAWAQGTEFLGEAFILSGIAVESQEVV